MGDRASAARPEGPEGPGIVIIPPDQGGPSNTIPSQQQASSSGIAGPPRQQRRAAGRRNSVTNPMTSSSSSTAVVTPQAATALARALQVWSGMQSQYLAAAPTRRIFRWRIPDSRSACPRWPSAKLEANRGIKFRRRTIIYTRVASATHGECAGDEKPEGDPAQYTLGKLRLPLAHGLAKGDQVLVAVIDSGVDTTHPEFAGVIADTYDVLDPAEPPHAHGTAIAGAIAAHSRLMGVAPSAKILAIRAFGDSKGSAEGTTFNIIKSIDWAIEQERQIINMSFAGPQDPALCAPPRRRARRRASS